MRATITILSLLVLIGGCATKRPTATAQRQDAESRYSSASVGTLAFDPPVTQYGQRLNLGRDSRQASAFVGFDQTVARSFYIVSDDHQVQQNGPSRFEHRSISVEVGTSYR